jgi:hypothetical protein
MPKYKATCNLRAGEGCRPMKGEVVELDHKTAAPLVDAGHLVPHDGEVGEKPAGKSAEKSGEESKGKRSEK